MIINHLLHGVLIYHRPLLLLYQRFTAAQLIQSLDHVDGFTRKTPDCVNADYDSVRYNATDPETNHDVSLPYYAYMLAVCSHPA